MRIECKHGLNGHVYTTEAVAIKHDLAHLLTVFERIHRGLRQENLASPCVDLHLLVKRVVPEVLHVIPFLNDAVFHWVANLEHGPGRRGLVTAHDVFDHQVIVALLLRAQDGSTDDGGILKFRKVLRRIADFQKSGAAIENCVIQAHQYHGREEEAQATVTGKG